MKHTVKRIYSLFICICLSISFPLTAFAQSSDKTSEWTSFISKAELKSIDEHGVTLTSTEKVSQIARSNSGNTYVSTTMVIMTSNQEESNRIAQDIQIVQANSSGDIGSEVVEKTGLGRLWIRVYYQVIDSVKGQYVDITYISVGHNIPHLSGGIRFLGSVLTVGQNGFAMNSGSFVEQNTEQRVSGTSMNFYPPSWNPVAFNGTQLVGGVYTVTCGGRGSSWKTDCSAYVK